MIRRSIDSKLIPPGYEVLSIRNIRSLGWDPTGDSLHTGIFLTKAGGSVDSPLAYLDITQLKPKVKEIEMGTDQLIIQHHRGKDNYSRVVATKIHPPNT